MQENSLENNHQTTDYSEANEEDQVWRDEVLVDVHLSGKPTLELEQIESPMRKLSSDTLNRRQMDRKVQMKNGLGQAIKSMQLRQRAQTLTDIQFSNFENHYDIFEQIGQGGSSIVKRCRMKNSKEDLVVQIIKFEDTERLLMISKEQQILCQIKHQNIPQFIDFVIDHNKKVVYLVMEYVRGFSIFDCLVDRKQFEEPQAWHIMRDILKALQYLHSLGICHRDLSYFNVIYEDINKIAQIFDFSISKEIQSTDGKMWTQTGNKHFMAPEIFRGDCYTQTIDVWSCGVILFAMLTGSLPFQDEYCNERALIRKITELDISNLQNFKAISGEAQDLIIQMLQKDPEKRISLTDVLAHPWMNPKLSIKEIIQSPHQLIKRTISNLENQDVALSQQISRKSRLSSWDQTDQIVGTQTNNVIKLEPMVLIKEEEAHEEIISTEISQ